MSYCVHCGVELDATAAFCPLCHTKVLDPGRPVDTQSPKPFPTERGEVPPIPKGAVAAVITAMLACVAVGCGLLNLFLKPGRAWSLYVIGATIMLWLWIVLPLLFRKIPLLLRSVINVAAVVLYVYLMSVELNRRSVISAAAIIIGSLGVFLVGVEFFIDRWLTGKVDLSWSLVVLTICVCTVIPLVVIRHIPAFREEVRRRFHT